MFKSQIDIFRFVSKLAMYAIKIALRTQIRTDRHFRKVPIATNAPQQSAPLFDHPVGAGEHCGALSVHQFNRRSTTRRRGGVCWTFDCFEIAWRVDAMPFVWISRHWSDCGAVSHANFLGLGGRGFGDTGVIRPP